MFQLLKRFRTRSGAALAVTCVLAACSAETPEALFAEARSAMDRKDYAAASIQLKNVLQKNPDFALARLELGRVSVEQRDFLAAEKELNKALDLGASKDEVVPLLVRVLIELGRPSDVASRFGSTRLGSPGAQAKLDAGLGYAAMAADDKDAALRFFDAALGAEPSNTDALVGKARLIAVGKDYAAATRMIEPLLGPQSTSIEAWLLEAEIRSAKGDKAGAIEALKPIYRIRPDHLRARSAVITGLVDIGKYDDARSEIAELRKIAPSALEVDYLTAVLLTSEGKFVEARPSVDKVLAKAPDYLPAVWLGALVSYQLKSYAQAEQHVEKLIAKGAVSTAARKILIGSYLGTGRVSKAQQALEPLLKSSPNDPELLAIAARVQLASGDSVNALRSLEQSAKAQPQDANAQSRLGLIKLVTGDYGGGVDALKNAARLDDDGRPELMLVLAHLRERKPDAALVALDALEKKMPNDAIVHNLRGSAYLLKQDAAAARSAFEAALKIQPTLFAAASNLAKLDLGEGKRDVAAKRFESILTHDGKQPEALLALAGLKAHSSEGRVEAEKLILRAVKENPDLFQARVALVQFYELGGDHRKAQQAAQAAVAARPGNTAALGLLADTQARGGDSAGAVLTRAKVAEITPNDTTAWIKLAVAQEAAGKFAEAEQSLKKALLLKPGLREVEVRLAGLYSGRKSFDEALSIGRGIQKREPASPDGYLVEGGVMLAASKRPEAIAAFRAAYAREARAEILARLLAALDIDRQDTEARKLADDWMRKHPKDVLVPMYEAGMAMGSGKLDAARALYLRVLEREPENVLALNNVAWLLWKAKDKGAASYAEKAYRQAPSNPAVLDTFGVILLDAGKVKEALPILRLAVEKAPQSNAILLNYARALARSDKRSEARPHLEKLAALGSKFDGSQEAAELLKSL